MKVQRNVNVAVLLATYNGSRFIEPQIRSLTENSTPFTLHWLDDHSSDDTREAVRRLTRTLHIELCEWHQIQHLGVPGAFFELLECVEADIYLFCDQDDIWQPGKIDSTVENLLSDLASPVICCSDPFVFDDGEPGVLHRLSDLIGAKPPIVLQETRMFMPVLGPGHTQGFTRPLREIYLRHKDIARSYAGMHDWWLSLVALGSGTLRFLADVPTTLNRRHGKNFSDFILRPSGFSQTWMVQQWLRRAISRQAEGFLLAARTLPPGPKLERLLAVAKLLKTFDRRQSPMELLRLLRSRAMWPDRRRALWLSAACLCSDVKL
jgi:glycosyltransferase involved in cell wall biosynthesis